MIYTAGHTERNAREENQDSYSVLRMTNQAGVTVVCACVADGITMRAHGGEYSRAAVSAFQQCMAQCLCVSELQYADREELIATTAKRFDDIALRVNEMVLAHAREHELFPGGTTFSAIAVIEDTLLTANIGDSPILLIGKDGITPIYEHGTVARLLLDRGAVTQDSPEYLMNQNRLEYYIGQPLLSHQYAQRITLDDGDRVMIASDGALFGLDEKKLYTLVRNSPITRELCIRLLRRSVKAGSTDNQTAVICSYIKEQRRGFFRRQTSGDK